VGVLEGDRGGKSCRSDVPHLEKDPYFCPYTFLKKNSLFSTYFECSTFWNVIPYSLSLKIDNNAPWW